MPGHAGDRWSFSPEGAILGSITEQLRTGTDDASRQVSWRDAMPTSALLWDRRGWLLRVTLIGLAVATVVAFVIPKRYESTVQLMPPDPQSMSNAAMIAAMTGSVGLPSGAAGLASTLIGGKSSGATFVSIVRSRTVQDDLIDRFNLRKVYRYKYYVDARKQLTKRTFVDEDKKSGIITIVVTDHSPYRARDLAAAYVDELDKLVAQLSTSSARRERLFLEGRLKAVKQDLDDASRELSQFSSRNATLDVQNQGKVLVEAAANLQAQLIAAESQLRGLEAIYSPNNIRVQSLNARIGELRRQLQKMSGGANETSADLSSDQLYPALRKLPLLGVTYYDLYRRTKIQEAVYEILTKQYELAKVQEAKEIPTVKVLDPPDVPEKKSSPPRLLIIVFTGLLTFVFAVAWIGLADLWAGMPDYHSGKVIARDIWGSIRGRDSERGSKLPTESRK